MDSWRKWATRELTQRIRDVAYEYDMLCGILCRFIFNNYKFYNDLCDEAQMKKLFFPLLWRFFDVRFAIGMNC